MGHRGGYYEGAGALRDMVQTLLCEVWAGDQGLFIRVDQIEAAWTLPHLLLDVWGAYPAFDFPNYPDGSWGPESAEELISRDQRSLRAPGLLEKTP